jgi:4-carboxymuconolactone decarboxylase
VSVGHRFARLSIDTVSDEQRVLAEQIVKVSSIGLTGPYSPLLRSPVLGQRMFDLLRYLRWNTSLPLRLNELAILIVGRIWSSQVEWFAHEPLALKAGLRAPIVEDLRANRRPQGMQDDEAVVYDFIHELYRTHELSDDTFARARRVLGEQQVVDLTALAGTYVTVAMLIAMSGETIPDGKPLPLQPGSEPGL